MTRRKRNFKFSWRSKKGEGLSGFVADVYGTFVVLYVYSRGLINAGRVLAEALIEVAEAQGVVLKVRPKGARAGKVKYEVLGTSPPEKLIVREGGIPFEVHLLSGLNSGLFTDLRELRHARRAGPWRMITPT